MRSIAKFSAKLSLAVLTASLSISSVLANTLSEIQINAQESGYGVVLKTDEAVPVKKTITANNKLSIELKDVEVSSDLNTVYNDAENIDNVTVVPSGKSGIKIVVKGQNVSDSKIYFDKPNTQPAVSPAQKTSYAQSIQLSAPVSSYTSVYNPEAFAVEEDSHTSNPQLNEFLKKLHIDKSMLVSVKSLIKKAINKTKSGDINMMTVMGILFIIAAFLFRPSKQEKNALKKQSLSSMLSRQNSKEAIQRTPQTEREIALNKNLASSMNLNKNGVSLNSGYGMKAYQNSQRNPYTTNTISTGVSGIPRKTSIAEKPISFAPIKKQTLNNKPVLKDINSPIKPKVPSVVHSSMQNQTLVSDVTTDNMDSIKFLESITKIYEKSGRADLAKGLKDNLQKARSNSHAII